MARPTYHHGDLRRALLSEARELTRSGGPDAVTLREVARRLGVSPAAIYRHFPDRDALLGAVADRARRDLERRMVDEVERVDEADVQIRSMRRFRAIGRGYLEFARTEPNLLGVAFLPIGPSPSEAMSEDTGPWHVLAAALDELVATGAMPVGRRAGAESIAWSGVHGFAVLRAGQAFETTAEPAPDPEDILDAIARALEIQSSRPAHRPTPRD